MNITDTAVLPRDKMKHIHRFCILYATLILHAAPGSTASHLPSLQQHTGRHRSNGSSTRYPRHSSDLSSNVVSSILCSEPLDSKAPGKTLTNGHEASEQICSTNGSGEYGSQTDLVISISYNYHLEITNGTMLSNVLPALEIALSDSILSAFFTECQHQDVVVASTRTIHTGTTDNTNNGHRMLQDVNVVGISSMPLDIKKGEENRCQWWSFLFIITQHKKFDITHHHYSILNFYFIRNMYWQHSTKYKLYLHGGRTHNLPKLSIINSAIAP